MKEIKEILRHYYFARDAGQACALATVVRVAGSTYRRPGARMFVSTDGRATGCVSGGCLEKSVFDQARRVMASGEPKVVEFDAQSDEGAEFGFGLGCNGTVEVLIEPLTATSDQMALLAECIERRKHGILATVFAVAGRVDAKIGDRLILRDSGEFTGNIADDSLRAAICTNAQHVIQAASQTGQYDFLNGSASVFVEHVQPPLAIAIFGAGHDTVPLVRFAKELGWHLTLVDYRPANVARARELNADYVIAARPEEIESRVTLDPRSAIMIMNHNYVDDLAALAWVIQSPARYVGILGPRVRTERMLSDLRKRGISWSKSEFERLYAPAGLDIGADNPEEIALSIVAEIHAAINNRSGESLREKSGPLHARAEQAHCNLAAVEVIGAGCRSA